VLRQQFRVQVHPGQMRPEGIGQNIRRFAVNRCPDTLSFCHDEDSLLTFKPVMNIKRRKHGVRFFEVKHPDRPEAIASG
jgi:hypothetical protein